MSRGQFGKIGVYNATPITLADQESSSAALDSAGNLYVTPASGASFGSSTADGATFTQGTTTGGIAMGVYVSSPQTLTTGKAGAIALDVNRNQIVVGNVASAGTDSGNPIKIGGKYNASAPTFTDGQRGDLQLDVNGNVKTTLATLIAGEDLTNDVLKVEQRFSYGAGFVADTQVKSGAGFLHSLTFSCNDAAPTAGTIDVYDNTAGSGTKIFSWTLTTAVFNPATIILDVVFSTGLYVDFTTTGDVLVVPSYR